MLNRCRAFKVLPRVRIPASPPSAYARRHPASFGEMSRRSTSLRARRRTVSWLALLIVLTSAAARAPRAVKARFQRIQRVSTRSRRSHAVYERAGQSASLQSWVSRRQNRRRFGLRDISPHVPGEHPVDQTSDNRNVDDELLSGTARARRRPGESRRDGAGCYQAEADPRVASPAVAPRAPRECR